MKIIVMKKYYFKCRKIFCVESFFFSSLCKIMKILAIIAYINKIHLMNLMNFQIFHRIENII